MSTTASTAFSDWLYGKLRELNTDESAFGPYIVSILESDETEEEKTDAVEVILSEIIEGNLQELITEILNKWHDSQPKVSDKTPLHIDVNEHLAKLLEAQKLPTVKEHQLTVEERKIKEQILANYSQTEVSEEEYEYSGDESRANEKNSKTSILARNTNAEDVMQLQKERREHARLESAAKKKKDKEDREKQKQLREEKKEKRGAKTAKGERRR